jgi:hypothetical protein
MQSERSNAGTSSMGEKICIYGDEVWWGVRIGIEEGIKKKYVHQQ